MRKIIVTTMLTLDGVMQAPGGPEEDTSGDFIYGGWAASYADEISGKIVRKQMQPAEYLLGRKTFEIFASYWPGRADIWPGINNGKKYVMSGTMQATAWENTVFLSNVEDIKKLKKTEGIDIQVWGSSKLIQLLLKHDLVDELWLKIYPLTLGTGKRMFENGSIPVAFSLIESIATPSGVIFANFKRAGNVETGTIVPVK